MKNETDDNSLYRENIFSLNRVNSSSSFEGGSNLTYGFDYERKRKENNIKFSLGQVINEKKLNDKMSDTSSLDKRFSDVVGSFEFDTDAEAFIEKVTFSPLFISKLLITVLAST